MLFQSYMQKVLKDITYLNWECQLHKKIKNLDSFQRKQSASAISKADAKLLERLISQCMDRDKMSFLQLFQVELFN
jgi:hypothetical protein